MDWLAFLSSIINSLAWPIVMLILVFVFISKGAEIAKVFKSIRYKDFELNFRDQFSKAKEISDSLKSGNEMLRQAQQPSTDTEEILKLAEVDRSLAVFKIWQSLEAKVIQLMQHNGLIRFTSPTKFIIRLLELGKINKADADLFNHLREIRNSVVHLTPYGHEVNMTMAEVLEYKEFVDTFLARLESIRQENGYIGIEPS